MTKRCSECRVIRPHILKSKHESSNYYVDDNGSRWRGTRCPGCLKSDHKSTSAWGVKQIRVCRKCSKPLPIARYFNCFDCHDDRLEGVYSLEGNYVY